MTLIRLVFCLLIFPCLVSAQQIKQKIEFTLTCSEEKVDWATKTIQVLKKRYQLLGISPGEYNLKPNDNSLKVTINNNSFDPVTLKHISYAQGNFQVMSIHKFDDESLRALFQTFLQGKIRVDNSLHKLTDYFMVNSYTIEEYKFRRFPPAVIGMTSADNIMDVNNFLNSTVVKNNLPANAKFCWSRKSSPLHTGMYDLYLVDYTPENGVFRAEVKDAEVLTKPNHYDRVRDLLYVTYEQKGKDKLKETTANNVDREMVAMIDGHVLTAPIVEGPIETGDLEVEGNFVGKEANLYRRILLDLQLPYPLQIKRE